MAAKENVVRDKSYRFALRIIGLYKALRDKKEFVISKQILRSGTSIGANVEEAQGAQSRKDFHSKMTIAHKEARETHYWLRLLRDSKLVDLEYKGYIGEVGELGRILASITKSTKPS